MRESGLSQSILRVPPANEYLISGLATMNLFIMKLDCCELSIPSLTAIANIVSLCRKSIGLLYCLRVSDVTGSLPSSVNHIAAPAVDVEIRNV